MSNLAYANETYQHGHHAAVVADHAKRTADTVRRSFSPFHQARHAPARCRLRTRHYHVRPSTSAWNRADTIGIDPSPA